MGSKLFRTLVGVGISLGVTSTGCWGQSNDSGEPAAEDDSDGDSSGSGDGSSVAATGGSPQQAITTTTTTTTTTTSGATSGDAGPGPVTSTTGSQAITTDGSGGSPSGTGGAGGEPGVAGAGGDSAFDPFCDATWPTTKGNPDMPRCVDPNDECQEPYPVRCLLPTGELACDGDFRKAWAPFCVNGSWQCEPGLVPATECRCFTPLAQGYICTSEGPVPEGGVQP